MIDLTIGIPCFNEAATIGKVVEDFGAAFPNARLLVIDNASTDATAQVAREHGAEVIAEPLRGKGNAVQRLFHETVSEFLVMVDGDDTYPAEEAHKLLAKLREAGGDTVVGLPRLPGRHGVQEHPSMGEPTPFPPDREIIRRGLW